MSGGQGPTLADVIKSVADLVGQSAKVGTDIVGLARLPSRSSQSCGCEIPPPCWAPQPMGDVTSRVCPGNKAVVRLTVTNCGRPARTFTTQATDQGVKVEPPSISVGPMERTTVVVSLDVPATAAEGEHREIIVWLRGCKEHFLRWMVDVSCASADCCTDVAVEDCPDLVHHWYDHFYCQRGCGNA